MGMRCGDGVVVVVDSAEEYALEAQGWGWRGGGWRTGFMVGCHVVSTALVSTSTMGKRLCVASLVYSVAVIFKALFTMNSEIGMARMGFAGAFSMKRVYVQLYKLAGIPPYKL